MAERRPDRAREHLLHHRSRGPPGASPVRFQVSRLLRDCRIERPARLGARGASGRMPLPRQGTLARATGHLTVAALALAATAERALA